MARWRAQRPSSRSTAFSLSSRVYAHSDAEPKPPRLRRFRESQGLRRFRRPRVAGRGEHEKIGGGAARAFLPERDPWHRGGWPDQMGGDRGDGLAAWIQTMIRMIRIGTPAASQGPVCGS